MFVVTSLAGCVFACMLIFGEPGACRIEFIKNKKCALAKSII